jgi:hypothetical protein
MNRHIPRDRTPYKHIENPNFGDKLARKAASETLTRRAHGVPPGKGQRSGPIKIVGNYYARFPLHEGRYSPHQSEREMARRVKQQVTH